MSRGRGKRCHGGDSDNGWGEMGGYMNAKKQKLSEQFAAETPRNIEIAGTPSGCDIFKGVSIHVNGYTVPSSDELKRLMMLHGGMYQFYYSKTKVTHIIATRLPYAKIKELRDEKIVRPDWILDSIKAGKLLSDGPYQLYKNRTTSQGVLKLTEMKQVCADDQEIAAPQDSEHAAEISTHSMPSLQGSGRAVGECVVNLRDEDGASSDGQNHASDPTPDAPADPSTPATGSTSPRPRRQSLGTLRGTARAGDANFVSEFYSNSRLHHISTWGAELKAFVTNLQTRGNTTFPGRDKLRQSVSERCSRSSSDPQADHPENPHVFSEPQREAASSKAGNEASRIIMHVDMDCFFVSVGLRNHPELRGKPVAVTHSRGKGMPSANREVREFEKAYYENKYGKASRSHQVTESVKGAASRLTDVSEDLSGDNPVPPSVQAAGEPHLSPACQTTSQQLDPAAPEPTKPRPEAFNSMAEIASCSYEARSAGLRNGMFMGEARRRCPDLKTLPYDFEGYRNVSQTLYEIVASFTQDIEAVSCDEMFVDITAILEETGATPLEFAHILRQEIKEKTQCNASAGLASNILLARLSTRKAKPNGQFFLETDNAEDFMKSQPVKDLPGVGHSLCCRLRSQSITTCGELQTLPLGSLQKEFGPKTGLSLYNSCRGIDNRPIRADRERKSVSAEINYGIRFSKSTEAELFVRELAKEVHKRLTGIQMLGKTITLKLKVRKEGAPKETSKFMGHGICDNLARTSTLAQPTDQLAVIDRESAALLAQMKQEPADLRGVGIQISRLSSRTSASASHTFPDKSLLDFAQPLPRIPSERGREVAKAEGVPEKRKKASILSFVSKERSGEPFPGPPQPKTSALPPLPALIPATPSSSSRLSRHTHRQEEEEFCLPSPSQLDPSVMAALPPDIRQTIEKSYQARKAQRYLQGSPSTSGQTLNTVPANRDEPLDSASPTTPTKPSTVDSELTGSSIAEKSERKGDTTTAPSCSESVRPSPSFSSAPHDIGTWIQPGTSNGTVHRGPDPNRPSTSRGLNHSDLGYDPSVLKELPEEIVQEILEQERRRAGKGQPEATVVEKEARLQVLEALPSLSQIDPSCMEALPSDLQRELHAAYHRQDIANASPSKLPPAAKPSSPFKLRRRRGRPRKTSPPPKGARQAERAPATVGILELVTGVKASPVAKPFPVTTKTESKDSNEVQEDLGIRGNKSGEDAETAAEPVNLLGAVSLRDVKALLKEWTRSVEEPGDEDIDHMVRYLNELVVERNLEMANHVLRAMRRLADQMKSSSAWADAYKTMENSVQRIISHMYSSRLKIG